MLEDIQAQLQKNQRALLKVKIIPKSKKNELAGMYGDDRIKIKIAAVPARNEANEELISFLSELLEVPKKNIRIITGALSPFKTIEITPST